MDMPAVPGAVAGARMVAGEWFGFAGVSSRILGFLALVFGILYSIFSESTEGIFTEYGILNTE